jgi:mono/diheme cytochrome c family protein
MAPVYDFPMTKTLRTSFVLTLAGLAILAGAVSVRTLSAAPAQGGRWTIPAGGADEKNPLPANEATLAGGKKLFAAKCQRCHGPAGKGDGPDADPKYAADMDLTVAARAARNTDGTVFYKVWTGRSNPKMPVFSEEMTKEQVWAVVAYVQTLRAKTQ